MRCGGAARVFMLIDRDIAEVAIITQQHLGCLAQRERMLLWREITLQP